MTEGEEDLRVFAARGQDIPLVCGADWQIFNLFNRTLIAREGLLFSLCFPPRTKSLHSPSPFKRRPLTSIRYGGINSSSFCSFYQGEFLLSEGTETEWKVLGNLFLRCSLHLVLLFHPRSIFNYCVGVVG